MSDAQAVAATSPSDVLLVTVEEAARRLAVSRTTLYQQLRRGVIPSVRIGHSRRVAVADLERYVEELRGETGALDVWAS